MATRRKDVVPGKGKIGVSSPQTGNRAGPNGPSKTNSPLQNHGSTASEKNIPNYLRPTRSSTTDVSKQQGKKPASTQRTTSLDRAALPSNTPKTRVSATSSLRSSSFTGKPIASTKSVNDKSLKAPIKDAGKQRSFDVRSAGNVKKSSTFIKKQETENSISATKEEITITPHENIKNSNISSVPEPETQPEDQESSFPEAEEQTIQVANSNEKGDDDLVQEDQDPLKIGQTEAESDDKDDKIVTPEPPPVLEQLDILVAIKTEEPEQKSYLEEGSSKQRELEEHNMDEICNSNNGESVADKPNEEAEEKEVEGKEVVVEEEEETEIGKKDEGATGSEAQESKETEGQDVVDEKKQEIENAARKQQQGPQVKKDSAVSNDVIEETASKLREQRKNKVKALAGAFETVISLQETK